MREIRTLRGVSLEERMQDLTSYSGWRSYFGF